MAVYDPHTFQSRPCRRQPRRLRRMALDAVAAIWAAFMAWCWLVIVIGLLG
jgi:hypothetical protein